MDITRDIQALTTFRNHSAAMLRQLKKTKRPVVLTVNGKAAAVVQDAAAYQRLLDIAARQTPTKASGKAAKMWPKAASRRRGKR